MSVSSSDTSAAKALASENSNFAGVNFGPIIYFFKSVSMQHKTRQLVCVSDGAKALSNLYGKYRYDLVIKYLNLLLKANSEDFVPGNSSRSLPMICDPIKVGQTLNNLVICDPNS